IPDGARTVTPGAVGGETVVIAMLADVGEVGVGDTVHDGTTQGHIVEQFTGAVRQFARAVDRIATITRLAGGLETTHEGSAYFTYQGQTAGAHDLVEEVGERGLDLGHFLAVVAMAGSPRSCAEDRRIRVGVRCARVIQGTDRRVENVRGVQGNRSVRT